MTAPLLSRAKDKPEWLTSMEAVLEVLNEGVLITNEHQQILSVNSRFIEMTGISRQDLNGSYASRFYSPQEWDFIARQINVGFQHGHNRYAFVLPRKDGGRVPVIISSRKLEKSGRQFGIVTFTDISEQVRTAEELRSANAKLQQRQMEIEEDRRTSPEQSRTQIPGLGHHERRRLLSSRAFHRR
jgi:PAS domain S-box-containing protein